MMKQARTGPLRWMLAVLVTAALILGAADYQIDDRITLRRGDSLPAWQWYTVTSDEKEAAVSLTEYRAFSCSARLFGVVPLKHIDVSYLEETRLCPGGMPFGAKIFAGGLLVTAVGDVDSQGGVCQPAYDAGIRPSDIIMKIDGKIVYSAEELAQAVAQSEGKEMEFTVRRGEEYRVFRVTPQLSVTDGAYRTGMWVRDSIAGIGTITYIEPESGEFAGLGHGICDTATGALLPISRGVVVHAEIRGIRKGAPGSPGELRGQFSSGRIGVLNMNAAQGVFGVLTELPVNVCEETAVPIAMKEEILDGEATLLCTVDENGAKEYSVTIRKIKNGSGDKNMEITVTDPELLEKTGGIVQGMSGSPLLQNGRLIGAVTHVLINNPAKGYGIYIENMLRAVQEAKTNGNMRQEGN